MKKLLIFLLFFAPVAYGQQLNPFGGTRPIDTAHAARSLRVDSMLRLVKYANTDSNYALGVDGAGKVVARKINRGVNSILKKDSVSNNTPLIIDNPEVSTEYARNGFYVFPKDFSTGNGELSLILKKNPLTGKFFPFLHRAFEDGSYHDGMPATVEDLIDTATALRQAIPPNINDFLIVEGDVLARGATGVERIAGNASTQIKYWASVGDGFNSTLPSWQPLSVSGYLTYYLHSLESEIPDYNQMANSVSDSSEKYVSLSDYNDSDIVQSWATNEGVPNITFIPAGTYNTHFHAYADGGDVGQNVQLYAEIYKRNLAGTETLIERTNLTNILTDVENEWTLYAIDGASKSIGATDRLVCKIRVYISSGGGNLPTIHVGFCGGTNARLELPTVAADVTNFPPYKGAVGDVDLGSHDLFADSIISNPANPLVYTKDSILKYATQYGQDTTAKKARDYANATFYQASNPNGYTSNTGTVTSVTPAGYMNGSNFTTTGTFSPDTSAGKLATKTDLNSYYLASNPSGYTSNTGTVTSVTPAGYMNGSNFTTTGTFSPDTSAGKLATKTDLNSYYLASNPSGYTSNTGTVTSVTPAGYMNGSNFTTTGTFSPDTSAGKLATKTDLNSYYLASNPSGYKTSYTTLTAGANIAITGTAPTYTVASTSSGDPWTYTWVSGSDFTSTVLAMTAITGLTTGTLSVSSTYEFEATLMCRSTTSGGIKFAGNCTASPTRVMSIICGGTTTAGAATIQNQNANNTGTTTAFLTAVGIDAPVTMKGSFTTAASGSPTFSIMVQKVTDGTATIYIGSSMKIRKVL